MQIDSSLHSHSVNCKLLANLEVPPRPIVWLTRLNAS
jgi:hypothetical protein